jgi:hypothetical protein
MSLISDSGHFAGAVSAILGHSQTAESAHYLRKCRWPGGINRRMTGRKLGHRMTRNDQVAVLLPMIAGSIAALCTILIHSVTLGFTVRFFRRERRLGRVGSVVWSNLGIFVQAISFAFVAHLTEIALWAALFVMCGEFKSFGTAYYHSAVNYTTLGYGDLIMTSSWKLLGPLEAAVGALMFGVSTAMIFAVAQRLMRAKFADLWEKSGEL